MKKEKKQIKWYMWFVIFALMFTLTIIIGKIAVEIQKMNSEEAVSVQINSKQIDTGIKLQTESKEAKSFTSFVTYPYTNIEAIDIPIHDWVEKQENSFHEEIEQTELMLDEKIVAHFNIDTEVFKVNDDIFSFVMKAEQHLDNDNEYKYVKTFTINLKDENLLEFNNVMNKDKVDQKQLSSLIVNHVIDEENNLAVDEALVKEKLESIDKLKWVIDKKNINFYFNSGEISDTQEIIVSSVPIIELHRYINDTFSAILITKEMQEEINRLPRTLDPKGKYVALTFDDGPSDDVTPNILKTLKKYDAKATFYMLSNSAARYPEIAKQVADEGHEIANHSVSHANLNAVNKKRIESEVTSSVKTIEEATGVKPKTFRPPYGEYNKKVIDLAEKTDQTIILWSIDTLDWKYRNANRVLERTKFAKPGSIILMHDIHPTTADALPKILKHLSDEGFEFVTVSELLPLLDDNGIGPYYGH